MISYIAIAMGNEIIQKLKEIGLNQLEAEVYHLLLTEQPMTAYKAGKMLKKPTANIYKAVEVLFGKGAVLIEEGKNKVCRAVKPQEFLAAQEREFAMKAAGAAEALSQIKVQKEEESTCSLESVSLALEKAAVMIGRATEIVVVDAFPLALAPIMPHLKRVIDRGVKVVVQAYSEVELEGADIFTTPHHEEVISYWQSQQLNVVVDGRETLIALFDKSLDKVYHATWSTNVYLSCIVHAGRMCEQTVHKLMAVPDSESKLEEMEAILQGQKFFRNSNVPGVQELMARYLTKEN